MAILHLHRLNRILCLLAVLALGSLTVAPAAYADTLTVCPSECEFTAIQPAIDSARSGDTIRIFSGVYQPLESGTEPIAVITDKSLVLEGVGATVLDCSGSCSAGVAVAVQLSCSQSHQITIKRLTIQGGGSARSGANLTNNGCKLRIIDSVVTGSDGNGIEHMGGRELTIKNSEISRNAEGAVVIPGKSKSFIINSTVSHSGGRFNFGGISNGGTMHLYHSTVSNNSHAEGGGGIANGGTLIVKHSRIVDNESTIGIGGISNGGTAIIEDSLIAGNVRGVLPGGGIDNGGKLTLIRSTVRGNSTTGFTDLPPTGGLGGGIYNTGDVRLIDTLVTQNVAARDGGGVFNDGGTVLQTKTLIINNTPNDCVGC